MLVYSYFTEKKMSKRKCALKYEKVQKKKERENNKKLIWSQKKLLISLSKVVKKMRIWVKN